MNVSVRIVLLFACLSLFCQTATVAAETKHKKSSAALSKSEQQESLDKADDEIHRVLFNLGESINAKDAAKTASFFSEDAALINEVGEEIRGRAALQQRFSQNAGKSEGNVLTLHPEKISQPAPGVALVIGELSRKDGITEQPVSRFSLVLTRQNGNWLINEATETRIAQTSAADHLKQLEWLIGSWRVDKPDSATKLDADWGAGRNFIISKCIITRGGASQIDMQIIGFDPRSEGIVSWHFDHNGGFGHGKWNKNSDGWQVEYAGVAADGSRTRASNIFALKGADEFSWHSTKQIVENQPLADSDVLVLQKVK